MNPPQTSGSWADWALFAGLGVAWGSSYLFIKIGVETLPPLTLVASRLAIGAVVLGVIVALRRDALPRVPRAYLHLTVMALLNMVIPFWLITVGEQTIDSALAAILNATVPLFTIVLAAALFADERITANRVAGLALGFLGVVIVVSPSIGGGFGGSVAGQLAIIGSSLSYASGNVYARRNAKDLSPMVAAFFQALLAFGISAALMVALERPSDLRLETSSVVSVVWLGIVGSGLAFAGFFRLLKRWGSTRTSLIAYVLPVVGIVLGFLVLRETIDPRVLLGTALIIGGIALVNRRRGLAQLPTQPTERVPTP